MIIPKRLPLSKGKRTKLIFRSAKPSRQRPLVLSYQTVYSLLWAQVLELQSTAFQARLFRNLRPRGFRAHTSALRGDTRLSRRDAALICSPELWQRGHGQTHPLKPERLQRTYELLNAYRAFDPPHSRVVPPRPPGREELTLFHSGEYVDLVARLSRGESYPGAWRYNFGSGDNPIFPGMYETENLKVGAALTGARLIVHKEVQVAFSFGGGLHHALPARASGFCVFNDAAVAIHWLLRQGLRVAYVDIDAHHGDGVQAAFFDTPQVLTISLHQSGHTLFPGTGFPDEIGAGAGRGYSINLPLAPYTSDQVYLWAFRQVVPPLVRQFAPDLLVTQLGIDTHYRDPLAQLLLTTHGYLALLTELRTLADEIGGWLALGGGGYAVDVVPRAWALAYGLMSGQSFPDELPPTYSARYGPGRLHDTQGPALEERVIQETRAHAQHAIAALQEHTQGLWQLPS
jgi:acetoin utilization protein AcuC